MLVSKKIVFSQLHCGCVDKNLYITLGNRLNKKNNYNKCILHLHFNLYIQNNFLFTASLICEEEVEFLRNFTNLCSILN